MQRTSGVGISLTILLLFVSLSGCTVASQNFLFHLCRYKWKHMGFAYIHGFLWLENAPDMDNLDWDEQVRYIELGVFSMNTFLLGFSLNLALSLCFLRAC